MTERSYTLPAIRVTAEERDAIKAEAESRGLSLSEWVRRVATGSGNQPAQPSALRRAQTRVAQNHVREAEGAQGSGAEPQPSPPERPRGLAAGPPPARSDLPIAPVDASPGWYGCPVKGCPFKARSPVVRCPNHARLVVPS